MNITLPIIPTQVFTQSGPGTMAEVLICVEAEMVGTRRRDTLSAFRKAASLLDIDWKAVKTTPGALRNLLTRRCAAELGLSDRRWSNICSLIRSAFERFGTSGQRLTTRIPLNQVWSSLLATVPTDGQKHWRDGLTRIACFCSATNFAPTELNQEHLLAFYHALVEEELIRNPRNKLKHTIACWNMCQKNLPGWPDVRLMSPFESTAYVIDRDAFPATFGEDIARWEKRVLDPDPMDEDAAPRALKPVTVKSQVDRLYRFASALVHRKALAIERITSLAVLVEDVDRFKEGLRFFLERHPDDSTDNTAKIAGTLRAVAKHHVRIDEQVQRKIDRISANLRSERLHRLTPKNRERLRQFDDPENVARLLDYPAAETARGRKTNHPHRRAKCFERAAATMLLITTSMRAKNIRSLRLDHDVQFTHDRCFISVLGDEVKNGLPLDFELPADAITLLREYIELHRPNLQGSDGRYLFPGKDGGPRPHNSMFDGLMTSIRKHTGLIMNPHLFRHVIAKIVVERDPGMALSMSRHLGHKRIDTTMQHYLGTEGRVVSRRIDEIVSSARSLSMKKKG
jgi:integrase